MEDLYRDRLSDPRATRIVPPRFLFGNLDRYRGAATRSEGVAINRRSWTKIISGRCDTILLFQEATFAEQPAAFKSASINRSIIPFLKSNGASMAIFFTRPILIFCMILAKHDLKKYVTLAHFFGDCHCRNKKAEIVEANNESKSERDSKTPNRRSNRKSITIRAHFFGCR